MWFVKNFYALAPPEIELIYIVEKNNTLITINCGVREAEGTQLARTYIGRRQATVSQWVALRPLFDVCAREIWYEGRAHKREAWWRQEATKKQLRSTMASSREAQRRRSVGDNVTK